MSAIRTFIQTHLLEPLKLYPTAIQDTLIELITQRLEELYDYSLRFPEIITPNKSRLDILKTIAEQFSFTIREDADIQEQINILENILYVYNKRGSLDTIENMWKYYGGDLPKEVKVVIPSYNLFRYSVSAFSGTHSYIKGKSQDGDSRDTTINSPGVYEIRLTNNYYPITDLREFLLRELVAAGNEIYFTNVLSLDITQDIQDSNPYLYNVYEETFIQLQLEIMKNTKRGLVFSGNSYNALSSEGVGSLWSGYGSILLELLHMIDIGVIALSSMISYELNLFTYYDSGYVRYPWKLKQKLDKYINLTSYCTPNNPLMYIDGYLYNSQGEIIDQYQGRFILKKTLLGTRIP